MNKNPVRDYAILIGNIIDHFDTSLYVFIAPILAPIFFPSSDPIVGLIIAYGVLSTSIFTKPLGAYIFGLLANNKGANCALSWSLMIAGSFTLLIGLVPSYDSVGYISPLIFVSLRIIREIGASGEVELAKLYILDDKFGEDGVKGSYIFESSTIIGTIIASIAATIIYYVEFKELWRIYHFFGATAALVGWLIRKKYTIMLPFDYKKMIELRFFTLDGIKILLLHKAKLIKIGIAFGFSYLTYSVAFIIMNQIAPMISDTALESMMLTNNFMLAIDLIMIHIAGNIVSKYDYKKIMIFACYILGLSIIPLWYFMNGASFYYILFVRLWVVFWGVVYLCPLNFWAKNQILGEERYLIVGIGSTIGSSLIGKISPAICMSIIYYTNSILLVALFIAIWCIITSIVIAKEEKCLPG